MPNDCDYVLEERNTLHINDTEKRTHKISKMGFIY